MYAVKLVFSQVMDHLPLHTLRRCVSRYQGERYVKRFSCLDQYLVMAVAQLTHRESLRDIEACFRAHQNKLYHMGIRAPGVARNTLSKANERRDWRIHADIKADLYTILRVLSVTLFEKMPLEQLLNLSDFINQDVDADKQLNLFDNLAGQ